MKQMKFKKIEEEIKRKDLIYKAHKQKYDFQQYETMRAFILVKLIQMKLNRSKQFIKEFVRN